MFRLGWYKSELDCERAEQILTAFVERWFGSTGLEQGGMWKRSMMLAAGVGIAVFAFAQTPPAPADAPAAQTTAASMSAPADGAAAQTTLVEPAAATDAPAETVAAGAPADDGAAAIEAAAALIDAAPAVAGDPQRGQEKAAVCAACHGLDGNSADPINPKLAGQSELYIYRQLKLYKSGGRENAIMLGFSSQLSPQDMRDIGAYYATQRTLPGVANDQIVRAGDPRTWAQLGEQIYRGGDAARGIPACMACHGPTGSGNPGSAYPHVAGQHADYTRVQLTAFRDGMVWGKGTGGHPITENANVVMAGVARYLSDEDIEALATYIEGLHRAQPALTASAAAGN
jgi:cytochrome c553